MAAATVLEAQLQGSMATSEDDAEFEEDDEMILDNEDAFAANNQLQNGIHQVTEAQDTYGTNGIENGTDDNLEDEDAEGEEDDEADLDAESEEDDEMDLDIDANVEDDADADAEGEEDDELDIHENAIEDDPIQDEAEAEDEDAEGVGAVKIQPGQDDEDEDEDEDEDALSIEDEDESSVSDLSDKDSEAETEVVDDWEAEAADEDDEAEPANPNRCVFCQQDEEHDPSEDFEEYLACAVCGDNAHRQCARNANALAPDEDAANWRCPGCVGNALQPEAAIVDASASPSIRRSSAPKLARDLLPSQRGAVPNSHSVFNQLIVHDDPMDGSRLLRKRKTSSPEAAVEGGIISATRKRRKELSDSKDSGKSGMSSDSTIIDPDDTAPVNDDSNDFGDDKTVDNVNSRASRITRPKSAAELPVSILKKVKGTNLIMRFKIDPVELGHILSRAPQPRKKHARYRQKSRARRQSLAATYVSSSSSQPFYAFLDRETDELKSKPYGGVLPEGDADTTKSIPQTVDREQFDEGRREADVERALKRAEANTTEPVKKVRKISGPASQVECINFGGQEIDTWYAAPYPEEYNKNKVLYICEFCLKYMNSDYVASRHKEKCRATEPPGDEIYREKSVGVFEVDGRKNPTYCQNLCLLAKLFLGSKTLYYDVEPFLFYVMTEYDDQGCHFVGYFSKEKRASSQNNVSCILTLPIHQRKGYGNLLIDFSYLLTRVEKKTGSPEKPLSDMGLVSYRNYWRLVLCYYFRKQKDDLSISKISEQTGMTADDIVSALEGLRAIVRDPVTGTYALRLDYEFFEEYISKWEKKKYVSLNPKSLVWTPYVMGRNNASAFDHAPLSTVAPREGEEVTEIKPVVVTETTLTNGDSHFTTNGEALNGKTLDEIEKKSGEAIESSGESSDESKEDTKKESTDTESVSPASSRQSKRALSAAKTNGISSTAPILPPKTIVPPIPPTRFEVFPPVPGARARPSVGRPRLTRPSGTPASARSRRARASGSARRPRTTPNSRRRSGGTGRGPGRWPKGTKKSDFGNAESGPGLPPRLHKSRSRLGVEVRLGSEVSEDEDDKFVEDEEEDEDAILYETPGPKRRKASVVRGKGKTIAKGMGKGKGKGKGKSVLPNKDDDDELGDIPIITGDVDAEGEDE